MPCEQLLEKYARLGVLSGVNIQPGQRLMIASPVECAPFVRLCAQAAYAAGASGVEYLWSDEACARADFLCAKEEFHTDIPQWRKAQYDYYLDNNYACLHIMADDPEAFLGVDPAVIQRAYNARRVYRKRFADAQMSNVLAWTVLAVPTLKWAQKVFPGDEGCMERLWEAIFHTVRLYDDDPVDSWTRHAKALKDRSDWLNAHNFEYLHYKNGIGTDLTIGLAQGHLWTGGAEKTQSGVPFYANMPTEEIFTCPHKDRIDGVLVSAMPLNRNGNTITDFSFTFKNGRVVEHTAKTGREVLTQILDTDQGARSLGEVALIPCDSPIFKQNILYYNTLFDENASCHFALGKCYSPNISGGESMSDEQIAAAGGNTSLEHVDFMIGTPDLCVTGIKHDGTRVAVFKDGNWAF